MPNTLAHLGIQGLATRSIIKKADLKWVFIGCIIPDIPWIFQRIIQFLFTGIDLYDLRLYATVQASLIFCLLLSLALALISKCVWRTFLILSINSLFHLLLDALQTKYGNGVNLLAPLSWKMTSFDLFWSESLPTYCLACFSLIYLIVNWRTAIACQGTTLLPAFNRTILIFFLMLTYFILPFFLLSGPESADCHFVKTLRNASTRQGKYIELDRDQYIPKNQGDIVRTFAGEEISVEGIEINHSASVSIKGIFVRNDLIQIFDYHVHSVLIRDSASYIGLAIVVFLWILYFLKKHFLRIRILGKNEVGPY
jgi:hypothetical protein